MQIEFKFISPDVMHEHMPPVSYNKNTFLTRIWAQVSVFFGEDNWNLFDLFGLALFIVGYGLRWANIVYFINPIK